MGESTSGITIRDAMAADVPLLLAFIQRKAAFDSGIIGSPVELRATLPKLQTTLFGAAPFAKALIAEAASAPVGFALFYFRYSSFAGQPSAWLDDLYVDDVARSGGVGRRLMARLASIAQANNCTHIAWSAGVDNVRGMSFYHQIGARIVEEKPGSVVFRADAQAIAALAQQDE